MENEGLRQQIPRYVETIVWARLLVWVTGQEIPEDRTGYVLDANSMLRQLVPDKTERETLIGSRMQEFLDPNPQPPNPQK